MRCAVPALGRQDASCIAGKEEGQMEFPTAQSAERNAIGCGSCSMDVSLRKRLPKAKPRGILQSASHPYKLVKLRHT